MGKQGLVTRLMTFSEVKSTFANLVDAIARHETRVLVQKDGVPVAALVSVEDLMRLKLLARDGAESPQALERIGAALRDVTPNEAERNIERIISEGRERDDAARRSA